MKRVIRLPEVATKLGVAQSTVYLWIRRGEFLPPTRLGRRTAVWDEAEVDAWLTERHASQREGRS